MKHWLTAILTGFVMLSAPAVAGDRAVLVELFTSQGCSSCPPADALLEELAERDDVVAIALHVDYWDYLGWRDTLGQAAHTERQKAYAHAAGHRTIYTPQMVIGGTEFVIGHRPMEVADAIRAVAGRLPDVEMDIRRDGNAVIITAQAARVLDQRMLVTLVELEPLHRETIRRGENAGRVITYVNNVTALDQLARWDGRRKLSLRVELPADRGAAVFVQEPGYGAVVAAAILQ